jgi:hypothetical protein
MGTMERAVFDATRFGVRCEALRAALVREVDRDGRDMPEPLGGVLAALEAVLGASADGEDE